MLTLLQPKNLIFLAALLISCSSIIYGWYWHNQYNKAQATIAQLTRENANCTATNELLQSGVQRWKAAARQYNSELKRKEALVAKKDKESKAKIKTILQKHYPSDCNKAIHEGVLDALSN